MMGSLNPMMYDGMCQTRAGKERSPPLFIDLILSTFVHSLQPNAGTSIDPIATHHGHTTYLRSK